jgi:hypothetical protein
MKFPAVRLRGRIFEPLFYAAYAGAITLFAACFFYSSLRLQTLYSRLYYAPDALAVAPGLLGDWSAPLDDVFIHFDFARSTARGHPFQWSAGNGYSSGGTSLLYPLVLGFGYWIWAGFRGLDLMVWAGMIACVSVFGFLLASRRVFSGLPAWASYFAPPALLGVGVLDWSLFSGMEVALFLGLWAIALIAWDDLVQIASDPGVPAARLVWTGGALGSASALVVATRPEAVTTLVIFAASAAFVVRRARGSRPALTTLICAAAPGALVILGQQLVNRWLTGDASAAGALTKLELYHPYLTRDEVFGQWLFHVEYQLARVANYHLTDEVPFGWIPHALAGAALLFQATRRHALLLLTSAAAWTAMVGLNGQVRWQNERYAMPAVAWLMLAAALGAAGLLAQAYTLRRRKVWVRALCGATAIGAVLLFADHQRPRFLEQAWFFGRASRNILDQHVRAGVLIRHLRPKPRRVLVGDAGAIPYAADLPALDIIGLGGYGKLPFARATRQGVGASIELIERMPVADRPDLMAIYPHWWDALPLWFGEPVPGGVVTVRGNVVCAGTNKVLYRPNWRVLADSARPFGLAADEQVIDELDFADVISEREHGYAMNRPASGHVVMKLLAHPERAHDQLWDAGRSFPPDISEAFELYGLSPGKPARLIFRVAPPQTAVLAVAIDGSELGELRIESGEQWTHPDLIIPAARVRPRISVRISGVKNERIVYHLWAVQTR